MSDHAKSSAVSRPASGQHQLAPALGWFSVGLGLIELLAPRQLCRALALEGHETLIRAYGAREVAAGIAILRSTDPALWVWGRVAGDAVDLATLALAGQRANGQQRSNLAVAAAAVAGVTILDVLCARGLSNEYAEERFAGAIDHGRAEVPGHVDHRDPFRPRHRLRIKESGAGRIVVVDEAEGHEFAYRLETYHGIQKLGAFTPRWAGGQEPSSSASYVAEARRAAEREAGDQGWAVS